MVDQYVYIQRAEINPGDYFCFLRLPLRVRERFRLIAEAYYDFQKENAKKLD
ncbi:hypothetical protein [uncultured virus]|uniref:Uncharacterized protein n=1 Tax=uncultured virus TaxID=340016 RepID=A0A218MNC0_9VIRU|nr:hypothetical protein [uncultured virus]DAE96664.1 MAG TPA: hypothetical protein [Caudoviricetes sp.]